MKKISFVLTVFILLLGSSCTKNAPEIEPELNFSTQELQVSNDGETKTIDITSALSWSASSSQPWCVPTPISGGAGTTTLNVTVTSNPALEIRSATITVTSGTLTRQISISQGGSISLVITTDEYDVGAEGEEITVGIQASGAYEIATDQPWITNTTETDPPAGTERTEKFSIETNPRLISREGSIRFTLGGITQEVTVRQEGQALFLVPDKTGMDSDAPALAQKMKVGWNLGNSLEAASSPTMASETLWGNPRTTKAMIDAVKNAGFNAVRIPCAWSGYIEDVATHRISESWLLRVKEVVDYCIENGMYAIINTHWDGGWLEENPTYAKQAEVNEKLKALWEQIAVAFRDYDEHLLFAGTNEVRDGYGTPTAENITVQLSYNQTFVEAVRATGGKNTWRNLVIQAYNTNIEHARNHLQMPADATDNRLMAEVHYYDPWDFAGDESSNKYLWGKDYAGSIHVSTWGQEDWADQAFGTMKTHFVDKGIPVILGEYGAILRSSLFSVALENHVKARNHYLNYVTRAAKENGMVPFYWDNGHTGNNGFGLFNRLSTAPVHQDAIDAIMSAVQ